MRAAATATFHGPKVGLWVEPGQGARRRGARSSRSASRAGAPAPPPAGLISERVLALYPRRARERLEVRLAAWWWSRAARRGSPARPPWPRGPRSARAPATCRWRCPPPVQPGRGAAPARADDAAACPTTTAAHTRRRRRRRSRSWPSARARWCSDPASAAPSGAVEFARGLAARVQAPLLLDADGLNAHAGAARAARGRDAPTVLTPHDGGARAPARARAAEEVDRAARWTAPARPPSASGAVVLLKGDDTIVARPGGPVAISPGGTPGAGHRRHRRRALRPDRRAAGQAASTRSRPPSLGALAHGRAGRAAAAAWAPIT